MPTVEIFNETIQYEIKALPSNSMLVADLSKDAEFKRKIESV